MTMGHCVSTTTPARAARAPSHRGATIIACALAAAFSLHPVLADAAPITFAFETTNGGAPFGHGSFTIDDAIFPFPHVVIGSWPTAPSVFQQFSYTDPHVGTFGKSDVASVHFEIGIDPFTLQWSPAISLWAFVIATPDNSHVLIGSVSGLAPAGALNTQSIVNNDPNVGPQIEFVTVAFPQRVAEPATLFLLGSAFIGFVARRRVTRRR